MKKAVKSELVLTRKEKTMTITHILWSFKLIILFIAANFFVFCFPLIKQVKTHKLFETNK